MTTIDPIVGPEDDFGGKIFRSSQEADAFAALRIHVSDAAIAAQLTPPTDAQWLAKCDRVRAAALNVRRTQESH